MQFTFVEGFAIGKDYALLAAHTDIRLKRMTQHGLMVKWRCLLKAIYIRFRLGGINF